MKDSKGKASPGVQILIVEDEIIVARDIEDKLQKLGYHVPDIASSGEEAIEKASDIRPDLVLMDITLEGDMDGVEAAEQIVGQYNLPVVYLTAHTDLDTLFRARYTEPYGYIIKPYTQRDLIVTIAMALYRHRVEMKLKIMNSMLQLSLKPITLQKQIEQILDLIFLVPRLIIKKKGAMYLVEDEPDVLVLKAHRGFSEEEQASFAKVPFGSRLCGRAASGREIAFADNKVDDDGLDKGGDSHSHYCVPILNGDRVFGVMDLYVKEGYRRDKLDEEFLTSVSNILSGIIGRGSS